MAEGSQVDWIKDILYIVSALGGGVIALLVASWRYGAKETRFSDLLENLQGRVAHFERRAESCKNEVAYKSDLDKALDKILLQFEHRLTIAMNERRIEQVEAVSEINRVLAEMRVDRKALDDRLKRIEDALIVIQKIPSALEELTSVVENLKKKVRKKNRHDEEL